MCGPLRGAVCGAIVFEGWAPDLAAAVPWRADLHDAWYRAMRSEQARA